jgi:hypothetical protein
MRLANKEGRVVVKQQGELIKRHSLLMPAGRGDGSVALQSGLLKRYRARNTRPRGQPGTAANRGALE